MTVRTFRESELPVVVWGDPPEPARRPKPVHESRTDWIGIVATLRERPGEWAMVRSDLTRGTANRNSQTLRLGVIGRARPGEVDTAMRKLDPDLDRYGLWARWVGEPLSAHDPSEDSARGRSSSCDRTSQP